MKFQFLPENFSRSENAPPFETRKIRLFEVERIFLKNKKMLDHFSILRPGDSLTALYNSRERKNRFLFLRIGDNRELPEVALGLKALCEPLGSDFQGDRQPSGKTVAGEIAKVRGNRPVSPEERKKLILPPLKDVLN